MWVNIMAFINNYQAKWLATDIALLTDIFANGVWGGEYYKMFEVFGVKPSTIDAGISALQLIRVGVLLYQGAVERQAKSLEPGPLEDKKDAGKNE